MNIRTAYSRHRESILFCAKFLAILVVFHLLVTEEVLGRWLDLWAIFAGFSAKAAGLLLSLFGSAVRVSNDLLTGNGISVRVSKGCDGLTASVIFVAAVAAFRASWKAKVLGATVGFAAIQILNVLRVVALFLTLAYFPHYFEDMHIYVMQALVIAFGVVLWFVWAQRYAEIPSR